MSRTFWGGILKKQEAIFKAADERIQEAQRKQQEQYRKRKGVVDYKFKIGDKVLRRNMRQKTRKGSKGEDRWLGPYVIIELSATSCLLKNEHEKVLKTRIGLSQLKPFLQQGQPELQGASELVMSEQHDMSESEQQDGRQEKEAELHHVSQQEQAEMQDASEAETQEEEAETQDVCEAETQDASEAETQVDEAEMQVDEAEMQVDEAEMQDVCEAETQDEEAETQDGNEAETQEEQAEMQDASEAETQDESEQEEVIDLEKVAQTKKAETVYWVQSLDLSEEHRRKLAGGDWLDDVHIYAASTLLKK